MIFLFCIDTSASMNQRTSSGVRFIDAAKAGIEHFMLKRATDPSYATDRFFLVSYEDGPAAIKAGWADDTADFLRELKGLQAFDLSNVGAALKKCFDLLNSNRVNSPNDTYGMGRQLWTIEPAAIILLTDGGMMMNGKEPTNELILPAGSSYHGSELYREPFRWDQRLHTILLKFGTSGSTAPTNARQHALSPMALATGGSSQVATSMRNLIHILDAMLAEYTSRRAPTVSIEFEPLHQANSGASTPTSVPALIQRVAIRNPGIWPIPEDYIVNQSMTTLPPRNALPKVVFKPIPIVSIKPPVPSFPADSYDLEPSPLVDWINENVPKGYALECVVPQARDSTNNLPSAFPSFALLLPTPEGVKFIAMPYNYHHLFMLLSHYQSRAPKWKTDFEKYLSSIPSYYIPPLKIALHSLPMPSALQLSGPPVHPFNLIADTMVATCKELPAAVTSWLDEMRERAQLGRVSQLAEIADSRKIAELTQKSGFFSSSSFGANKSDSLHRSEVLLQIDVLRSKLLVLQQRQAPGHTFHRTGLNTDDESKHHVPISEMGDFQAYLAKQPPPLRSVDLEASSPSRPYFGNPFSKGADSGGFVDEVGESSGGGVAQGKKKRKRKSGVGERADRLKQFMISDAANNSTVHVLPSPGSNAAPSNPTHNAPAPHSTTNPTLLSPSKLKSAPQISNPATGPHSASTTQSFIQMQKSRKENLTKWERAQPAPQTQEPNQSQNSISPVSILAIFQANNALKLHILTAITRPNAPDESLLKFCYAELKGSAEIKDKIVREWIYLASLYHVDITPFFKNVSV